MKKGTVIILFSSLILLSACNSKKETSTSDTTIKSSTTTETNESTPASTTTDSKNTLSSQSQSSSITFETSQSSEALDTGLTEAEAVQQLKDTLSSAGMDTDDIGFTPFDKVGDDYLFKAQSLSILAQGGTGTIGFYRVSPQGVVTETDPAGNPY